MWQAAEPVRHDWQTVASDYGTKRIADHGCRPHHPRLPSPRASEIFCRLLTALADRARGSCHRLKVKGQLRHTGSVLCSSSSLLSYLRARKHHNRTIRMMINSSASSDDVSLHRISWSASLQRLGFYAVMFPATADRSRPLTAATSCIGLYVAYVHAVRWCAVNKITLYVCTFCHEIVRVTLTRSGLLIRWKVVLSNVI